MRDSRWWSGVWGCLLAPVLIGMPLTAWAAEAKPAMQTLCEPVSLLTLPDGAAVLKATGELQSMCADFATSAARNDTLDSLRWDFHPLDVQWQQYRSCFQELAAPDLALQLTEMDETVQSLQELLDIAPLLGLERALELAGQVDMLVDLLQRDVMTRVQPSPRYTPQFRRDIAASAEAVHQLTTCTTVWPASASPMPLTL